VKELAKLISDIKALEIRGSQRVFIQNVCIDSRQVGSKSLFAAIRGTSTDGHLYIGQAIQQGAAAIVCEELPDTLNEDITYVLVKDAAEALGNIASAFHNHPSRQLKVIGVTGTNGKTTTTTLLFDMLRELGLTAGLISTVEVRIDDQVLPATHTTPDPVSLHGLLSEMVVNGCQYVFMEVSSHAIHQRRIAGVRFAGGVFTNMSHDHLDYHKTFDAYIQAKKMFFDNLDQDAFALVNIDDKRGEVMLQNCRSVKRRYGIKNIADFKARVMSSTIEGLHLQVDGSEVFTRLIGDYNAYNLLAAYSVAMCLDFEKQETLVALSVLKSATGRFEYIVKPGTQTIAVVDYAHTPDALEKVVQTCRKLLPKGGRLIVVVGCGGNRDRTKRPVMGKIAVDGEQTAVLTSDNPRGEEPMDILNEMTKELTKEEMARCMVIEDRKTAIKTAANIASNGDIILIAGKGHEKYQEIKGVKTPFDDKKIIEEIFGLQ